MYVSSVEKIEKQPYLKEQEITNPSNLTYTKFTTLTSRVILFLSIAALQIASRQAHVSRL